MLKSFQDVCFWNCKSVISTESTRRCYSVSWWSGSSRSGGGSLTAVCRERSMTLQSGLDYSPPRISPERHSVRQETQVSWTQFRRINFLRFHRYSSSTNCNIQLLMKLSLYSWFINLKWIQKCSVQRPVKIRKSMKTGPNEFNDFTVMKKKLPLIQISQLWQS